MKKHTYAWAVILLLISFAENQSLAQNKHSYAPKVGRLHQEFVLPTIDGDKMVRLSDFGGKKLLLFHFASW